VVQVSLKGRLKNGLILVLVPWTLSLPKFAFIDKLSDFLFTRKLLVIQKLCSLLLDKEQQNNILGNLLQDTGDVDRATVGDVFNGASGSLVRARPSQATNPHSLVERVRKCKSQLA
jgi:hypothetical protein